MPDNPQTNLEDLPVYKALKEYRYKKSRDEGIKPYFIFNNAQMEELIRERPRTKSELTNIAGFGEVKAEKYGQDILSILEQYK
jgi:superfamily II DNA helicase RecQ